ncbi:MAG TPA: transcriptional regulator [Firmicutes bacterium]|nr:transcriptional regulator [Bacillota bacterium]
MTQQPFDFKKAHKELYMPKDRPVLVEVPEMKFIMVDGNGDPNDNPAFQEAIEMLYAAAYAVKMSKKEGKQPERYFDFVVPPLEGLWWSDGPFSLTMRDNWKWTLMIRQPDFVDLDFFQWAVEKVKAKKPHLPMEKVRLESFTEGLCVQILHVGPYSAEPETMAKMAEFMEREGLVDLVPTGGKHHEIYLSDPRKSAPETMKTVLRHPVARKY